MKKTHLLALGAVLLLGFGIRYLAASQTPVVSTDGCVYLATARNLAEGRGFVSIDGEPMMIFPPLFPVSIAAANHVIEDVQKAGFVTTITLGLLLILASFVLAKLLLQNTPSALAVALLVAVHPRMVEISSSILSEVPYTLMLVSAAAVFVMARDREHIVLYALTGLLLGLAYLSRVIGFFYLPVFLLMLFMMHGRQWKAAGTWIKAAGLLAGFLIPAVPYLIYLHHHSGVWSIHPEATRWWGVLLDYEKIVYGTEAGSLQEPRYDSILATWVHEPVQLLRLMLNNFRHLWIDRLGLVFPPWFAWPAVLGFLLAPPRFARASLFLLALFLPLCVQLLHSFNFRHLYPLVPVAAVWVPMGVWGMAECIVRWLRALGVNASETGMRRTLWVLIAVLLLTPSFVHGAGKQDLPKEQRMVGEWIAEHLGTGRVIMARKPWFSFYSRGLWHAVPYADIKEVIARARDLGVEYLILDERFIPTMRPQLAWLLEADAAHDDLVRVALPETTPRVLMYRVLN